MRCDEEKRRMGTSESQLSSPSRSIGRRSCRRREEEEAAAVVSEGGNRQAKIKERRRGFRVFERRGGGFHGPNYFTKGPS